MICENPRCQREFVPKPRGTSFGMTITKHCCSRCWHAVRVSKGISTGMVQARRGRMEAARKKLAACFAREFGELSAREVAIIRVALRHGWQRGYGRLRGPDRKRAA